MNAFLSQLLLIISNALLIPVMILLLVFFMIVLLNVGGLFSEYISRHKLKKSKLPAPDNTNIILYNPLLAKSVADFEANPENSTPILDCLQISLEERLNLLNISIRLGPILGLAGTLIPLGPALMGLSDGQVDVLAQNLVVAFTTTVVGLFIGGLSYVVYAIRNQWYVRDLHDLETYFQKKIAYAKKNS